MPCFGLTTLEARAVLSLSPHLSPGRFIACLPDPRDGLVAHVMQDGVGAIAAVARINGQLALLDFERCLDGASGRYDAIADVVNALWLSLAEFGPGPAH